MAKQNIYPKGPYQGRAEIIRRPDTPRIDYRGLVPGQNTRLTNGTIRAFLNFQPGPTPPSSSLIVVPAATATGPGLITLTTPNAAWFVLQALLFPAGIPNVPGYFAFQCSLANVTVTDWISLFSYGGMTNVSIQNTVLTPGTAAVGNNVLLGAPPVIGPPVAMAATLSGAIWNLNFDSIAFANSSTATSAQFNGVWGTGLPPTPLTNNSTF